MYIAFKIIQAIVLALPVKFSYWLGLRIADIHFYTSRKDRELVINNLKNVLGKDDKQTRRIARATLRNFGKYLVEFFRFEKMGKEYFEKHVKVEGVDNLKRALAANKGVIAFSAHLGNWEWGAAIVAQLGYPINSITLTHKDKRVDDLFNNQRAIRGIKNIPLGGSVKRSLKVLANNELVAILSDRDFSNKAVTVNFFGKAASMPIGTGLFAIKSKCALLPTFIIRQKDDTHKMIFDKPLEYDLTGDKEKDVKNIVQKTTTAIEKYIRLYPEQWFMFDNPWKVKNKA